jgi:hypothetical protein
MDPQLKSTLTTILAAVLGGAGVWAVKVGVVPVSDQANFVNMLVTVVIGGAGAVLTWYKARQLSAIAVIAAVNNTDNGLKVVAASAANAPTRVETAPLK